jgi:hypothetical protein
MNIIGTVKYKEDSIVLRENRDLLDISSNVLGESNSTCLTLVSHG